MGEQLGATVGFMIGADRVVGRDTAIRFVTTGWAFEKLIHNEQFLEEVTHLVLDEVHERTIDADLLHLLIKLVLPKIAPEKRPRVVLMSATFNAGVFANYYSPRDPPEPLYVGAKRYPVITFFLEDFKKYPPLKSLAFTAKLDVSSEQKRLGVGGPANTLFLQICRLLHEYHASRQEPCCILVFLSGIAEIDVLWEHIEEMEDRDGTIVELQDEELSLGDDEADALPKPDESKMKRFQLCALHSSIDKEDQMVVFSDIPVGKTRIILSTNIAESSVTIPNARYVIDAGYHKHMAYDERLGCTSLRTVKVSKAAAKQRAGRTGRLFPGVALRFFTEQLYEEMPEYDEPDMLRLPLLGTVLRLKVAAQDEVGFVSPLARPSSALASAIDPPSQDQIEAAYHQLFKNGYLMSSGTNDLDDSLVTPLGKFLQHLNVDVRFGSLIVTAITLFPDYLPHAIVLAVSMSLQNVFVHANTRTGFVSFENQGTFFDLLTKVERNRAHFAGNLFSDPFACMQAFGREPRRGTKDGWLYRHGLHPVRMNQLHSQSVELAQRLLPFVPRHLKKSLQDLVDRRLTFEIGEKDSKILRFIMCVSLHEYLLGARLKLKSYELSSPERVGFKGQAPYSDWRKCVFIPSVPQDVLEIGGIFEKQLLDPLFVRPHRIRPKLHVGKTRMVPFPVSSIALEFESIEDAQFAQNLLEHCCKNGKMTFWKSHSEKIQLPAPLSRTSLSLTMLAHETSAKLGGISAVASFEEEGFHFVVPSQTIFVQRSVIVEDVTLLPGNEPWVWNSVMMSRASSVASPNSIAIGPVPPDAHEFDAALMQKLVYLKHTAVAAMTTQFTVDGRPDLGAEICRVVLGIEPLTLMKPALKSITEGAAAVKSHVGGKNKATVVVMSAGEEDAKVNVVPNLSLKTLKLVAVGKVLKCPLDELILLVTKSGRELVDDAVFVDVLATEADTFGVLRLSVTRKGEVDRPATEEETVRGPVPSFLSQFTRLKDDFEDDAWLLRSMVQVLSTHSDGRMLSDQFLGSMRYVTSHPERITAERLQDVAILNDDVVSYTSGRGVFCLVGKREKSEFNADFSNLSAFSDDSGMWQPSDFNQSAETSFDAGSSASKGSSRKTRKRGAKKGGADEQGSSDDVSKLHFDFGNMKLE